MRLNISSTEILSKKVAHEAENLQYKELFNTKTNSIKKLWENLNMITSFKNGKRNNENKIQLNSLNSTNHPKRKEWFTRGKKL